MIVRNSILAILANHPSHGYGLKSSFEQGTGGVWPLNVGQVYSTLSRLERDGLVQGEGEAKENRSWRITDRGRRELAEWYEAPVDDRSTRDELVIKVLIAVATGEVEMAPVLQTQRAATMKRLQEYTRHKVDADPEREMPWVLMLDALILRAEAEVRWLDLCQKRLDQVAGASA
ncbi:MAG: PadR family transcriptional regulator [Acidobacteriota bacterium]